MTQQKVFDHHWVGLNPSPEKYIGFVYLITDVTASKYYIGRKQYHLGKSIKGCKSKSTDRQDVKWKEECWKESDWKNYKGSSPSLKKWYKEFPDHEYKFEIISQCRSKGELHYKEIEELVMRGALWVTNESGEFIYFNRQIPACRFRVKPKEEGVFKCL